MRRFQAYLPEEVFDYLTACAAENRRSLNNMMTTILSEHMRASKAQPQTAPASQSLVDDGFGDIDAALARM